MSAAQAAFRGQKMDEDLVKDVEKLTAQFAAMQSGMGAAAAALQMARDLIDLLSAENQQLRAELQGLRSAQEKPAVLQ